MWHEYPVPIYCSSLDIWEASPVNVKVTKENFGHCFSTCHTFVKKLTFQGTISLTFKRVLSY